MKIHRTVNPVAYENTYYIEGENHLIVVDPGSHWSEIRSVIETINKPICAILLTHTHYDHILSLDLVRDTFGNPPVYVAESEASWLYTPVDNLSGLPRHDDMADVVCRPAEHTYVFHEEYQIEEFRFTVLPTPGHSIGGASLVFPDGNLVLTGDTLFRETIGRDDLPTGSLEQMLDSIRNQLFTLPNYDVYPGHGPATTIAHEKVFNPFF
ncbi:MBL fold metallo-hydrolase [Streptococcus timonensis]|uniref:MBL fold metallo-hydrolase n=1 Tax=Streptococcus timonensis TaxID=1852387 RepID=UPI0039C269BD